MLATPSISVTLGNFRYDSHVTELQIVRQLLPGVNRARVSFPRQVTVDTEPDDQAVIAIDAGDGEKTVLTGTVQFIERRPYVTIVHCSDGSHELSRYRPCATFERQNVGAIARSFAGDIGLQSGQMGLDLGLPMYAAHQKRTAAEHIAFLAKLSDGFAVVDGEGKLALKEWAEGPADAALLYGRDLLDFQISRGRNLPSIAAVGNGPAGSAEAPEALVQADSQLPQSAPAPGNNLQWQFQSILRTPSAVQTAQSGLSRESNQKKSQANLTVLLHPGLEPGMKLELQQLPYDELGMDWLLFQVIHEFSSGAGSKTLLKVREAASGGSSLLGSLASAAGGLL